MKKLVTEPIRFYQKHISPHTPPSCRYHPTCSTYALQAVEKHGAVKGSVMGLARIFRCNPFVEGGVDEVPDYFTVRRNPDNIDDFYVPEFMMPANKEAQERSKELLEKYEEELKVFEQLPSSLEILQQIADVQVLSVADIEEHFTEDELDELVDSEIFPDLESDDFQYYTLKETAKNKDYLEVVEPYDADLAIGADLPLVVLEKPGIWYTNLPKLGRDFVIRRGVTADDIENKTYHLWLVLNAMDEAANESDE